MSARRARRAGLRPHERAALHCLGYVVVGAAGFLGGLHAQPGPVAAEAEVVGTVYPTGPHPCETDPGWCRPLYPSLPRSDGGAVDPVTLTPAYTPLTGPVTVTDAP